MTESQAHFLSLYFFICFRGSWGCSAPLSPSFWASSLGAPIRSEGSYQERTGEVYRRVKGLCSSWLRVKRYPFPALPNLLPASHLISRATVLHAWLCAWPRRPRQHRLTFVTGSPWAKHSTPCFMGTGLCFLSFSFHFFFFFFLAVLGLRRCAQAFSSFSEQGLLFVAVRGLLIAVASLVAEHRL